MKKPPQTVGEVVRMLQKLIRLDPKNAYKLVLCTAGAGYVHEYDKPEGECAECWRLGEACREHWRQACVDCPLIGFGGCGGMKDSVRLPPCPTRERFVRVLARRAERV